MDGKMRIGKGDRGVIVRLRLRIAAMENWDGAGDWHGFLGLGCVERWDAMMRDADLDTMGFMGGRG